MNKIPEWHQEELLRAPIFSPLHSVISRIKTDDFPTLQVCNELLSTLHPPITVSGGRALSFVPQEDGKLPFEAQYEPRCYLNGEVSTRSNNWHDLFNALVWLAFPKAKAALNRRHYQELVLSRKDDASSRGQRGSVRDTSTLLDESGVIVPFADAELAALLRNFQWNALFWQQRTELGSNMGFYLFGHGLYEKALHPYIGMTGQGLLLPVEKEFFTLSQENRLAQLDELFSAYLSVPEHCGNTRELTPIPILGVPGWAVENEQAEYYDNTNYFRSGRHGHSATWQ